MQLFVYHYSNLDFLRLMRIPSYFSRDLSSTPGPGRSPGEENDHLSLYSSLGRNSMDRRSGRATVHGWTESD